MSTPPSNKRAPDVRHEQMPREDHAPATHARDRHSAIALGYRQGESAPRVVAKGYGVLADTIMRTAREHGLYVHESPELVGLLMQVDLDARIPPQLYAAVAELLAWLYHLDNAAASEDERRKP